MGKNDPAFPVTKTDLFYDRGADMRYPNGSSEGGLTKREWFAGMAMLGLLASPACGENSVFAEISVELADALISELERTCTNTEK